LPLDVDLKVAREGIGSALTLRDNPQRLYRACTIPQRKILDYLIK
jgi:hypothetical protein